MSPLFRLKVIYCKRSVVNTYGLPVPVLACGSTCMGRGFRGFSVFAARGLTNPRDVAANVDGYRSQRVTLKHELKCMY